MSWEVMPRYSASSPAMVDMATALRVAEDEKRAYAAALEGAYGAEMKQVAEVQGLKGIVISRARPSDTCPWRDEITGFDLGDLPYHAIRHFECLTFVPKKGGFKVFFRRQFLLEVQAMKGEPLMMPVLRALDDQHQLDPFSKEAQDLWQKKHVITPR